MIVLIKELSKNFIQGSKTLQILKSINLEINQGETVAITGQSGSGKTTLLSLLCGLDLPHHGDIQIDGEVISQMNEQERTLFRGRNLGIVFQQFHLMPHLTALENVALPLEINGRSNAQKKAEDALAKVGLLERLQHFPEQLSGGEKQRVAIARAMVTTPRLLIADEPSGNLDNETGEMVMNLLFELVAKEKITLLLVTHDPVLAARCSRQLRLKNGELI